MQNKKTVKRRPKKVKTIKAWKEEAIPVYNFKLKKEDVKPRKRKLSQEYATPGVTAKEAALISRLKKNVENLIKAIYSRR